MTQYDNSTPINLGFLSILQESSGYLGGYLVTNIWGRPLEFRLSSAVQPNRVQQILYAETLQPYLFADLIGKTLVDKTATSVNLILTDCELVLELRQRLETPVAWVASIQEASAPAAVQVRAGTESRSAILRHPRFADDTAAIEQLLARVDATLDLAEPFARIREAINEARKTGVTGRN